MTDTPLTTAEFEQALRAKGAFYHIHHPYHVAMYEGRATREQDRPPGVGPSSSDTPPAHAADTDSGDEVEEDTEGVETVGR